MSSTCFACDGTGYVEITDESGNTLRCLCPNCGGTGTVEDEDE